MELDGEDLGLSKICLASDAALLTSMPLEPLASYRFNLLDHVWLRFRSKAKSRAFSQPEPNLGNASGNGAIRGFIVAKNWSRIIRKLGGSLTRQH